MEHRPVNSVNVAPGHVGIHELLGETVIGYIFWCIYLGIAPMIWFYPLNELEISGYEVFIIGLLSPVVLGIPGCMSFVQRPWVLGTCRLLTLASLASFQAPTTLSRLSILALGCVFLMLVFTANLWSANSRQRTLYFWGLILGLFAVLASRVWFVTYIPTWWDIKSNSVVIAVGAIATIDKILSGDDQPVQDKAGQSSGQKLPYSSRWVPTALGTGSLIYLTSWLFGELSLVSRWVVTGYPTPGPAPNPFGMLIFLALVGGIFLGCHRRSLASNVKWWLLGALGMAVVFVFRGWIGFSGGLVMAVYTTSIWPEMIDRLTVCPPARTVTLTMLTAIFGMLFLVWTVAFNFVPGGIVTRERSYILATIIMLCILLALKTGTKTPQLSHTAHVTVGRGKVMPTQSFIVIILTLVLITGAGFAWRQMKSAELDEQTQKAIATAECKNDLVVLNWNFHFGYDNTGWPSLERAADIFKATGADVISMQESDASKPFLGNNDLGGWLGEKLGFYVDFGPSTRDHTWGQVFLSKYPIVKSKHILLPSPEGEVAPAVVATINMTGRLIDFVTTHMGNDRDNLDRLQQADVLAHELNIAENPAIFLGYVTSAPGSRDYTKLLQTGRMKDIDPSDKDRWCLYIFYRDLIRLNYARISHGGLSDTELQIARFRLPENRDSYKDNDHVVTDDSKVDKCAHLTSRYGRYSDGHNWIWDHKYHMSTPKYFV